MGWLGRLLGRSEGRFAVAGIDGATAPAGRRSVWGQLAGDPGAAELRAQWEARWEEF